MLELIPYLVIFTLTALIFSCSAHAVSSKVKRICFIAAIILPIGMLALRYDVGTDYRDYLDIFHRIDRSADLLALIGQYEIFHVFLCKLVSIIGLSGQWVFFIYALVTVGFSFAAIAMNTKTDKERFVAGIVYLFVFFPIAFNVMREAAAIAIALCAITCLLHQKTSTYIWLSIFCFMVHIGSLILLPFGIVYALNYQKSVKKKVILLLYGSFFLTIVLLVIGKVNLPGIFHKLSLYLNTGGEVSLGLGLVLTRMPLLLLFLFFLPELLKEDQHADMYVLMYLIYMLLINLGYFNYYLNRFGNYFVIGVVFLTPLFMRSQTIFKNKKLLSISIYLLALSYFIYEFYINGTGELFPYQLIG